MTARYIMSRTLSEMKKMARSARIVAMSGCVIARVRSGVRCVCSVRDMPSVVVRRVRSGEAMDGGSRRGRREA
jgi:hypothetical protein